MSWQDEENKLPLDEQIELMAQDMDRLMTENERFKRVLNNNILDLDERMNEMQKVSEKAIHELEKVEKERREAEKWLDRQEDRIITMHDHMKKTLEEREQKKFLVKFALDLILYIGAIVVLYKALTTSLWETLQLNKLYEHFQGQDMLQLILIGLYVLITLGLLIWLVTRAY
ncbi:TPA: hypothetical protein RHK09_002833 [Enterococcus faecalis]|nr:hypothetical protein [Enterococcus faecalis]HDT7981240.1 hypothetical protein [Enterococcus faecalis]HDT7989861.1 hypothetical protein [Enterococcus faecalis]HDT8039408.1 hypothetical protein [Enterococcus faecalis]HDT8059353.1 hypothetical protein [Enterococcus faecalis]